MKTRNVDPIITTYVDVDNYSVDLLLMEGFPFGAGSNVRFRCGDGIILETFYEFQNLRFSSLPSNLNYEFVKDTNEEYDFPANDVAIEAIWKDSDGNDLILDVTKYASIPTKINVNTIPNEFVVSVKVGAEIETLKIPIIITYIDLIEANRNLVGFRCSYTGENDFIASVVQGDSSAVEVFIPKSYLVPIVTYHIEHSNGLCSDLEFNAFEIENFSSSPMVGIVEFSNGQQSVAVTLNNYNATTDVGILSQRFETERCDLIYCRMNCTRNPFYELTFIDDGVSNQENVSITSDVMSNVNVKQIRMPFLLTGIPDGFKYVLGGGAYTRDYIEGMRYWIDVTWYGYRDYYVTPLLSNSWKILSEYTVLVEFYCSFLKKSIYIDVKYTNSDQLSKLFDYTCDKPKYDLTLKLPKINGGELWKRILWYLNPYINTELPNSLNTYGDHYSLSSGTNYGSYNNGYTLLYLTQKVNGLNFYRDQASYCEIPIFIPYCFAEPLPNGNNSRNIRESLKLFAFNGGSGCYDGAQMALLSSGNNQSCVPLSTPASTDTYYALR